MSAPLKMNKIWVMLAGMACLTASAEAAVTLTDHGSSVTLANGLVSATIDKGDGKVTDFRVGGSPDLTGSKGYYYTTHVVSAGVDSWVSIAAGQGSVYSVTTNSAEMIDISIRNTTLGYDATSFPNGMFDVDMHYVMRDGVAGFYKYLVWRHHEDQPEAGLYQQRTIVADTSLADLGTTYTYCGGDVWNMAPGDAQSDPDVNYIYDSTYELTTSNVYTHLTGEFYEDNPNWPLYYTLNPDAMIGMNYNQRPVYTKYDWSVYAGPETSSLNTFGVCTENYGVWLLNGSLEYVNGGPTKLRGTVQYDDLNFNANETHGQDGDVAPNQMVAAGEPWEKIYGPYMIYANAGADHADLWADAQAQGAAVVDEWPHAWVAQSESMYPRNRGAISGQLTATGQSTANAQIVVCDNASIDWIWQGAMNYIYFTQADADGNFTVPKVRPGTYSVFAYGPGIVGDYQLDGVVVAAGETNNLGSLSWNTSVREELLFRVGTPDRSSEEFRFGDLPKQFGLWFRYLEEVGADGSVDYTVGTSDPKADWYYAQPVVAAADGTYASPSCYIHFDLDSVPSSSTCTLSVGLSGSVGVGAFNVEVNGNGDDVMPDAYHGEYTLDDNALDRDATVRGQQQEFSYTFDTHLLQVGENTVKLKVRKSGGGIWTDSRPAVPGYGIMYDYVQLEAGALTANTPPTGLTAAAASDTQMNLSWSAAAVVSRYNIKRATASDGPFSLVASAVDGTSYSDSGLSADTAYYYVVCATNGYGESADSTEVMATTLSEPDLIPPAAPSGFSATVGDRFVLLNWSANDEPDLDGYTVYRSLTGDDYIAIATDLTSTNYSDETVLNGTTCFYVVTATDTTANESSYSTDVSVTPHAPVYSGVYYENGFTAGDVGSSAAEQGNSGTPVDVDGSGAAYTTVYECGDYFYGAFISSGSDVPGGGSNAMGGLTCRSTGGNTIMFFDLGSALSVANGTTVQVDFTVGLNTARPLDNGNIVVGLCDGLPDVTEGGTSMFSINDAPMADAQTITISSSGYYDTYYNGIDSSDGMIHQESLVFTVDHSSAQNLYLAVTCNDASGDVTYGMLDDVFVAQLNPIDPPSVPTGLEAVAVSESRIDLLWSSVSGADSYNVKRSMTSGGPYSNIVSQTGSSYSDSNLTAGTTYYYAVNAENERGESVVSAEASARTYRLPMARKLEISRQSGDETRLILNGIPGTMAVVQASSNLTGGVWMNLDTNIFNDVGYFEFFETNAPSPRFYRLKSYMQE